MGARRSSRGPPAPQTSGRQQARLYAAARIGSLHPSACMWKRQTSTNRTRRSWIGSAMGSCCHGGCSALKSAECAPTGDTAARRKVAAARAHQSCDGSVPAASWRLNAVPLQGDPPVCRSLQTFLHAAHYSRLALARSPCNATIRKGVAMGTGTAHGLTSRTVEAHHRLVRHAACSSAATHRRQRPCATSAGIPLTCHSGRGLHKVW